MRTCMPEELPAPPEVRAAVREFVRRLRERTDRAGQLIVYGSTARGEYGPDSDVDIWVDWDGDEQEASYLLAELNVALLGETGVDIMAMAFSGPHRARLQQVNRRFFRAVQTEGLALAG